MNTDDELIIPLGKTKIVLAGLAAGAFVAFGVWLVTIAGAMPGSGPFVLEAVGIAAVAFFGLVLIYASRKLLDNSPGLIINSKGILDNSSGMAAELIPWNEITHFSVKSVRYQRLLTVHVRDPERYLNKGNFWRRTSSKTNYKYCGSPVLISVTGLKTNIDELLTAVQAYFARYGGA